MMVVSRSRRRLIALFLTAVLLPCALLVLLTVHGMKQERELAEKRATDERARVFVQVRQALRGRLDDIASRYWSARAARTTATPMREYTDASVRSSPT
jgi:hypothetical protein